MNTLNDQRTNDEKFQALLAFTKEAMENQHVPGVAIGLWADGKEYSAGLGITSVENPLPVTPETLFMIGSATKTYTAAALFRLVEEGKVSLSDRVRQYLPDFKVRDEAAAAGATLHHLLDHTAGWLGDYMYPSGWGDDNLARYVAACADIEQFTPLGEVFTYNNTSFNIAGRVIEVVTGKTFEEVIREMILVPLEMKNSVFSFGEVMLHRFVVGHQWNEETGQLEILSPWGFHRCENPAGGLVSTVVDQLKYLRFHMGDGVTPKGERLLSSQTLQLMQTPAIKGDMTWMGLNWFIWDIDGVRFINHDGSTGGQQADLWFCPEHKLALVVLTNEEKGYLLHAAVTRWVREHYLGVVEKEPEPVPLSESQMAEYLGSYLTSWGDRFEFTPHKGGLLMTHIHDPQKEEEAPNIIPPMGAVFIGEDQFIFTDPPFKGWKYDFLRGKNGQITYLRFSGRVMAKEGRGF